MLICKLKILMVVVNRQVPLTHRAITLDIRLALVGPAASRQVLERFVSVGVVALGCRANRVQLLLATAHVFSPLHFLGQLAQALEIF